MEVKEFLTKKRICALLTSLIIILEMFSPYGVLINKVHAATTPDSTKPYFELSLEAVDLNPASTDSSKWDDATSYYFYDFDPDTDTFETYSGTKAILIDVRIKNGTTVNKLNTGNIKLSYDTSKLIAAQEVNVGTKRNPIYEIQPAEEIDDMVVNEDGIYWDVRTSGTYLDASAGIVRIDGGTTSTMEDETLIATYLFKLADGVSFADITKDLFQVKEDDDIMLAFDGGDYVNGKDYLFFDGFAEGEKQVSSITLKTIPDKTKYYVGETLDFTGGEINLQYDDGTEETVNIVDAINSGKLTVDSTVATNSKKVNLKYNDESVDFEYYVLDSISVSKNLDKMSYEHGDTIELAGGELTATYKNNAGESNTQTINIANEVAVGNLAVDKTKADVDNTTITFTYFNNKTANMTLTVTDPITSISITKQPNTLTYDDGDTINLEGGEITPVTKSGKTLAKIPTDSSTVTASTTTASIASAINKWTIAGGDGLQAGNQKITLAYEGKTADLTIVVNDTVAGVEITTQTTAKNKYGTSADALNFEGLEATVNTTGGGTFKVGASSLTIDTSSYNPNSTEKQLLSVKYGTVNSTNKAEITLSNYITGITINFNKTEFEYGTTLDGVVAEGTYLENYADGTSSSSKAITSDMVKGYNGTPEASLFSNHEYSEILTIEVSTSENEFDLLPARDTQTITIKDVPESISVQAKPNKTIYNYGEDFLPNGGQIKVNYKSGASEIVSMGTSKVTLTQTDGTAINMNPQASELVDEKATKTIKVNYAVDGNTFTTTFDITIKDVVESIAITKQPQLIFEHNDTFDASTGEITVTFKSGNTTIVNLDEATITQADGSSINMAPDATKYTNNELTQTLKVEYLGATANYNITIRNTVESITVTAPTKTTYNLNEATDLLGGKVLVTRKAGDTKEIELTDTKVTVTNFDTSVAGIAKTANVKYTEDGKDYFGTFNYDVLNNIANIEIVAPSKVEYKHGETLDLTGATITVKYADGTSSTRTMTTAMITEQDGTTPNMEPSDYNDTNRLDKILKITYEEDGKTESVNYPITIINTVKEITIQGTPKTNYNVNEELQEGLSILVTREKGLTEAIEVTKDMITNFDTTEEGTRTATITYVENGVTKTVEYTYTVTDTVTSISVETKIKEEQKYNEELDLTGATIKVISGKGTKEISVDQSMIKAGTYDKTKLGEQTVTITYGGQEVTTKVTVKDYVTKISVEPKTVTGTYGDTLTDVINNNSIKYTVTYAKAGEKEAQNLIESMVSGYNENTLEAQSLTVKYVDEDALSYTNGEEFVDTLTVTLSDEILNITVTAPTSEQTYKYGETLDLTGATITINYVSGATPKTVTPTASMVVETGTTNAVNMMPEAEEFTNNKLIKQVTLTYEENGKTGSANYEITIINTVKEIKIQGTPKTNYNVNEELQEGLSILVTREKGLTEAIEVTKDMITNFDTTEEGTRTATITYVENGVTKTVEYTYTVTDTVTSISVETKIKEEQKYNEELDLAGATIKVISGKGTKEISVDQSMIKAGTYDKTKLGEQTVTITYGGQEVTTKVTVKDYVTKISVEPKTVTGTYGDTLTDVINNNSIKYTVTYAKAGEKEAQNLIESMVSGYNENTLEAQSLTVKYVDEDALSYTNGEEFVDTLTVTLSDEILNITVTAPTSEQTYKYGETLDLTGATITINYVSGATPKTVTPTASMVVEAGTTNAVNMMPEAEKFTNNKLTKQVTLTYEENGKTGSVDYSITIVNPVTEISIGANPKTSYNIGDSLDLTTGTIIVKRATGTDEEIALTDPRITVTGFNADVENTNLTLTVTFTENGETKSTNYEVSVVDSILSMEIETLPKQDYLYNEPLDVTTGRIKVTRSSGIETINMTENMVKEMDDTAFNSKKLGTRNLKVTYGGITKTYEITVSDYVTGIIVTPPTKINYEYNEPLDLTGGTVQKIMASGAVVEPVNLETSMISGFDNTKIGAQTVTVNYEGKQANFGVIVSDNIQTIEMNTTPKTAYKFGEALDVTNGTIKAIRSSGAEEIIPITESMVTGFNSEVLGNQELTVTYNGKQTTYEIEVQDYVIGIEIVKPTKLVYNVGETIDLTNGEVKEIMASNTTTLPIPMNSGAVTITGFETTSVGVKTITVTYKGFSKTFDITVVDPTSAMIIKTLPNKLDYKYGEDIDLTGGTIQVTKVSGATEIINITKQMIQGYNSKKLGNQVITVTYEEYTAQFSVNVEDYVKQLNLVKPTKVEYEYGEELNLDGGEVSILMASGQIKDRTALTASMVEGFNKTKEGKQTLKVTYKGLVGEFDINVTDKVKAISMEKQPDKTEYEYGEKLDLTGAVIRVVKSSGIYQVPVTDDMVSGYDATTPGTQIITVTYKGESTIFVVKVGEKPIEPVTPTEPSEPTKPSRTEPVIGKTDKNEEETKTDETVNDSNKPQEPANDVKPQEPAPIPKEDENSETEKDVSKTKKIAGISGLAAIIILLLLLTSKNNTKIYVQENEYEYVLGGKEKLSKKHKKINVDKYLDKNTYSNKVKIVLDKKIAKKLNKQELEIRHRGKIAKRVVKYNDKEVEIVLK